ncbi:hypothetical protein ACFORL_12750 [Legionella dresdenensis]|uniref:Stress-induced bacterial acidophilic repeat motif protein n=1 Tax=Legionella dresdenensis TaxID=450200 RepID=A0ABV8CIY3_9GAMM
MAGTHEGGIKAVKTREKNDPGAMSKMGAKGGHESSGRKAMETRAEKSGKSVSEIAADMGRKGGQSSHGGHSSKKEEDNE